LFAGLNYLPFIPEILKKVAGFCTNVASSWERPAYEEIVMGVLI